MSEPTCINLRETYGDRYRITYDPAAQTWGERQDPWMHQIACRYGVIFPQGGTKLAVEVNPRGNVARRLAGIAGVTLYADADDCKTFHFDVALFQQVAEVVQPRKRRHLSPEQASAMAALSPTTFRSETPGAQSDSRDVAAGVEGQTGSESRAG